MNDPARWASTGARMLQSTDKQSPATRREDLQCIGARQDLVGPASCRQATSAASSILTRRQYGGAEIPWGELAGAVVLHVHVPVVARYLPEHTVARAPKRGRQPLRIR